MEKAKKWIAIVREKAFLAPEVIKLSLEISSEFTFTAGQFLTIKICKNQEFRLKSYSILNPPSQKGKLDFCIKLVSDGFASAVFEKCKIGDPFEITGPLGHFMFDEKTSNEHWFIGAGTGITPLYSIIKEYVRKSPQTKFVLLFGAKTEKYLLFHEEFQEMAGAFPHFTYLPTLSRQNWEGKIGHVQEHLPENLQNKTFYICGLKELVLETKGLLIRKGVDPCNIRFERYT